MTRLSRYLPVALSVAFLSAGFDAEAGAPVPTDDTAVTKQPSPSLRAIPAAWLLPDARLQAPASPAQDSKVRFKHPDAARRQVVPFLEGTRVLHHIRFDSDIDRIDTASERPQLRFEADIQPNLVAAQNFSDKLEIGETLEQRKTRWAYSVVGTPRVRLRMFNARSAPVRTPSYMPKGSFTGMALRGQKDGDVGMWAGMLTVGHHSNGQDGCLFETDRLEGDDCVGTPDLTRINLKDGSFSTNYVRLGARYRRTKLRAEIEDSTGASMPVASGVTPQRETEREVQAGYRELTLGVDVDLHFHTDKRIAPFYGQRRVEAMIGGAIKLQRLCRSRATGQISVKYIGTPPLNGNSVVFQADATCTFNDGGGWGLFARFYRGQDYYNLGFARSLSRLQFGFHHESDGFLRFVRARSAS